MNISFTTVVNTLFFSAIAIVLLCLLIDRTREVSGKKFLFFSFMVIIIMLRLFVPCEILEIQNNVYITRIYPSAYLFLTRTKLSFFGKDWSIALILLMGSLIGSMVCAVKTFLTYSAIFLTLKSYGTVENERISKIISAINREWGKNTTFRTVQNKKIAVPFLFCLRNPVIALPEAVLSERELYYILSHEMAHYYHGDLWMRFVCEVLHIVYWWNPLVYLLRRHLVAFQERHIDAAITGKLDEDRRLDYLSCLVSIAKLQFEFNSDNLRAGFSCKAGLQDRIKGLLDLEKHEPLGKGFRLGNALLAFLLVVFTMFLPNLVTLEPNAGIPDEIIEEGAYILTPENAYLVLDEDGKYEVYANGEYKFTSSQILEDSLHVYNRKGEIIK